MKGTDSAPTIRYEISHTLASESVRMMQDYNEIEEMGRNGRRYSWEVQRGFFQAGNDCSIVSNRFSRQIEIIDGWIKNIKKYAW